MTRSRSQFAGGVLPQDGRKGEVRADRASRPSNPQNFAIGSPQAHDLGSLKGVGHRETVSSIHTTVLLTPRQAAEFLGVPESTLAQWRSQRRGPPYIKLELRLVRYRLSDVEAYLSQHAVETEVDKAHA